MIPGWGIEISHAPGQKEKKERRRSMSNTTGMVMTGKGITRFEQLGKAPGNCKIELYY